MIRLMLDAAYPPDPSGWVAALSTAKATVGAFYAYNSNPALLNYTPTHVSAVRAAKMYVLPIIVPGDKPPLTPTAMVSRVAEFGVLHGPVVIDIERYSTPPLSFIIILVSELKLRGYIPIIYCSLSNHGTVSSVNSAWWMAEWKMNGIGTPAPTTLPENTVAWQYANDVPVDGKQYDFSIIDGGLFVDTPVAQTPQPDAGYRFGEQLGATAWKYADAYLKLHPGTCTEVHTLPTPGAGAGDYSWEWKV